MICKCKTKMQYTEETRFKRKKKEVKVYYWCSNCKKEVVTAYENRPK